jgi:hypothetical protein
MSLGGLRGSGVIPLDVVTRSDPGAENDKECIQTLSPKESVSQPGWLHKSGRLSESSFASTKTDPSVFLRNPEPDLGLRALCI